MGCCLFATILAGAPRLALVMWWIFQPVRLNTTFPNFIWPLLGILFIPWTTLMYVIVYPSGINGFDWLWLGSGRGNRHRLVWRRLSRSESAQLARASPAVEPTRHQPCLALS